MPYQNEHAGRLRDPGAFDPASFVRVKRTAENGKPYSVIMGKLEGEEVMTEQAYRYPSGDWSAAAAHEHAKQHGAISFEEATGKDMSVFLDKDVIAIGSYNDDRWLRPLVVTLERMQSWIDNFQDMRLNGIDVPLLTDHLFGNVKPDEYMGNVVGLRIEGDRLIARCEIGNEDIADEVRRVGRVSPGIVGRFRDSQGNDYGEVIEHLALTPRPVIPGQDGFVLVAASRGASLAYRKQSRGPRPYQETRHMELREFSKKLHGLMREAAGMDGGRVLAVLMGQLDADDDWDADRSLSACATGLGELRKAGPAKLDAKPASLPVGLDPDVKSLSRPNELDPDVRDTLIEAVGLSLDGMVESGRMTPDERKTLEPLLTGSDYMLSRKVSGGDRSMAQRILAALQTRAPVHLMSRTGPQDDRTRRDVERNTPGRKLAQDNYAELMGMSAGDNQKGGG